MDVRSPVVGDSDAGTMGLSGSTPSLQRDWNSELAKPLISVVMPVLNARQYLKQTVPALVAAAQHHGSTELIFIDNGSTDGSYEFLLSLSETQVRVYRCEGITISALRNYGAHRASGAFLSFVDADCLVAETYFDHPTEILDAMNAVATGCEYNIPATPHWIEETWHLLHYIGRDRHVHYLNAGNFFISREAFDRVGGFDESLLTGEDAEIGGRIRGAGLQIYESTRVDAIHLGNPKSIGGFYRRNVWHALGMFATVGWRRLDKPTAMMFGHLLASVAGIGALFTPGVPLYAAALLFVALQLVVPSVTVLFRSLQTRRFGRLGSALGLYWVYYWARLQAMALIVTGLDEKYRK